MSEFSVSLKTVQFYHVYFHIYNVKIIKAPCVVGATYKELKQMTEENQQAKKSLSELKTNLNISGVRLSIIQEIELNALELHRGNISASANEFLELGVKTKKAQLCKKK